MGNFYRSITNVGGNYSSYWSFVFMERPLLTRQIFIESYRKFVNLYFCKLPQFKLQQINDLYLSITWSLFILLLVYILISVGTNKIITWTCKIEIDLGTDQTEKKTQIKEILFLASIIQVFLLWLVDLDYLKKTCSKAVNITMCYT